MDWPETGTKVLHARFRAHASHAGARQRALYVWDDKGRRYLDFVSGIAVNSLGHCHPAVVKAVNRQVRTLIHTSNLFYTTPQLELAELLVSHSAMRKVFFCNSGTEAVEGAVKLARRWGHLKLGGLMRSLLPRALSTGARWPWWRPPDSPNSRTHTSRLPAGFVNVNYNDIEAIKAATTAKTCAVLLEPVQGEGGVNIPAPDYLKQVRAWCDEKEPAAHPR